MNILPLTISLVRMLLTSLGLIRNPRNLPLYSLAILPSSVPSEGLSQGTQAFFVSLYWIVWHIALSNCW